GGQGRLKGDGPRLVEGRDDPETGEAFAAQGDVGDPVLLGEEKAGLAPVRVSCAQKATASLLLRAGAEPSALNRFPVVTMGRVVLPSPRKRPPSPARRSAKKATAPAPLRAGAASPRGPKSRNGPAGASSARRGSPPSSARDK